MREKTKVGTPRIAPDLKAPSSDCVYSSKISYVPIWMEHFQKQTLNLNNFGILYPNAVFFGALEPAFTCQQDYMKIWTA